MAAMQRQLTLAEPMEQFSMRSADTNQEGDTLFQPLQQETAANLATAHLHGEKPHPEYARGRAHAYRGRPHACTRYMFTLSN